MNYKNVKETNLLMNTKNLTNSTQSNGCNDLNQLQTINFDEFLLFLNKSFIDISNNSSLGNIHEVLHRFEEFRGHPYFLSQKIFELFQTHSVIQNLMNIMFGIVKNDSDVMIPLADEIFYLFFSVSKSPSFTFLLTSLGFIQFFFQNFNQFSINSQQTGVLISNNCVNDFDDNAIAAFFNDEMYFELFLNTFPHSPTEFSFLLFTIISKVKAYPQSLVIKTTDLLSSNIAINVDPKRIENIFKILAVLLSRYPKLSARYIKMYHSSFKTAFQFYEVDFSAKNNFNIKYSFFEICRMLVDNSVDINRLNSVINHIIPTPSLLVRYLTEVPMLQYPILKLFLSMITKSQDAANYLFDSMLISSLLRIQNSLKFQGIEVMHELLGLIIEYDFKDDSKIIIEILVKMLEYDIPVFQDSVLEKLIIICKNLSKTHRIEDIRKYLLDCDGINTINELSAEFQKAQIIASELSFADEVNIPICF